MRSTRTTQDRRSARAAANWASGCALVIACAGGPLAGQDVPAADPVPSAATPTTPAEATSPNLGLPPRDDVPPPEDVPAADASAPADATEEATSGPDPEGTRPDEMAPAGMDSTAEPSPAPDAPAGVLERLPDTEAIRLLAADKPDALGPLSIGAPDAGLLVNPMPLPDGPLWIVRNPSESYGTTETIAFLVAAIEAVEKEWPGSPRLCIGDLSRPDGGRLNRHRSHQTGRDVDIGFYVRGDETCPFVRPGKAQLDVERTWALVRALVTETDVERIFVDRSVQKQLYAHALAEGEDRDWLDDIFGRRRDAKGIVQHERRHKDHLHVRFYNARAQEWGRVAYPTLVKAGVVPGPTLMHRVRRGETLGHLARRYGTSAAAIRAANGLRGSFLRAGRSYVIPVRRMPPESDPIVVPPRRLPPEPPAATAGGASAPPASPPAAAAEPAATPAAPTLETDPLTEAPVDAPRDPRPPR